MRTRVRAANLLVGSSLQTTPCRFTVMSSQLDWAALQPEGIMDTLDGPSERIVRATCINIFQVLLLDRRGEHLRNDETWKDLTEQVKEFVTLKQEFNSKNEFYFCELAGKIGFHPLQDDLWMQADSSVLDKFFKTVKAVNAAEEYTDLSELFGPIESIAVSGPPDKILRLIVIYTSLSSVPVVPQQLLMSLAEGHKAFIDVVYYVPLGRVNWKPAVAEIASTWAGQLQELDSRDNPDKCFFAFAQGADNLSRALAELLVHPKLRNLPREFRASSFVAHPMRSIPSY
nr:unnamed protein product [Spirometra erinaceieuropaei]